MIRNVPFAIAALPLLALAACGDPVTEASVADEDFASESAALEAEPQAVSRAIDAGDFAGLELGAKVEGPQGSEVKTSLSNEMGVLAEVTSYVACPAGMAICNPSASPAGTIYTYVHIVNPGENMAPRTLARTATDEDEAATSIAFMMAAPAFGFTGEAGYSRSEANAAGGQQLDVVVTCEEDGQIFWTITPGEDGNGWASGEPITFYWRSTLPPAGPSPVYSIRTNSANAVGPGPYPAADDSANNACTASSTRA